MRKEIPDRLRAAQLWGDQAESIPGGGAGWQLLPLVKVDLPQEYARDWTLLIPPIANAAGGNGTPLSGLVVAPDVYQPTIADYGYEGVRRPGGGTGNCVLVIRYGGGKTTRDVKIDYPVMGATYGVRGSVVEVFAMFNALSAPGLKVGAEIVDASPPEISGEAEWTGPMLCYTFDGAGAVPPGVAANPGDGVTEVPVNAVAVRVVQLIAYGAVGQSISLEFDGIGGRSTANTGSINAWQTIPPGTIGVRVLNTNVGPAECVVEYRIAL